LPRGRSGLPSEQVRQVQRLRILRAIVAATAESGYADVTVRDVVSRARVSRSSFYAQFTGKEDCFFEATAEGRRLMFERIGTAVRDVPRGRADVDRLRAGLQAYLRFLTDEPAFASVFYLELPAVGRRGGERLAAAQQALAVRTAEWHARARRRHRDWPCPPMEVFRALTGATEELVRDRVRDGSTNKLCDLEDVVVGLHLRVLTNADW
jgi:AcrR family transcriptional regulator